LPAVLPGLRGRRGLARLCTGLAVVGVVVAAGRPSVEVEPAGRILELVVDVSTSTQADDLSPTRFQAIQQASLHLLDRVDAEVRVGLVSISTRARRLARPTTDHEAARKAATRNVPILAVAVGTPTGTVRGLGSDPWAPGRSRPTSTSSPTWPAKPVGMRWRPAPAPNWWPPWSSWATRPASSASSKSSPCCWSPRSWCWSPAVGWRRAAVPRRDLVGRCLGHGAGRRQRCWWQRRPGPRSSGFSGRRPTQGREVALARLDQPRPVPPEILPHRLPPVPPLIAHARTSAERRIIEEAGALLRRHGVLHQQRAAEIAQHGLNRSPPCMSPSATAAEPGSSSTSPAITTRWTVSGTGRIRRPRASVQIERWTESRPRVSPVALWHVRPSVGERIGATTGLRSPPTTA
jgi:hypothetical protein